MERTDHLHKTKRVWAIIGMAIGGVILAMLMALLFAVIVMWLWNWLMPAIFGLTTITFWQAWGLLVLSHILFKSFPHKNGHPHDDQWKKKFRDRFCNPRSHKDDEEKDI